jgi:hypothetical protein
MQEGQWERKQKGSVRASVCCNGIQHELYCTPGKGTPMMDVDSAPHMVKVGVDGSAQWVWQLDGPRMGRCRWEVGVD